MSDQYNNDICDLEGCYGQRDDCSYLSPDYIDSAHGKWERQDVESFLGFKLDDWQWNILNAILEGRRLEYMPKRKV